MRAGRRKRCVGCLVIVLWESSLIVSLISLGCSIKNLQLDIFSNSAHGAFGVKPSGLALHEHPIWVIRQQSGRDFNKPGLNQPVAFGAHWPLTGKL